MHLHACIWVEPEGHAIDIVMTERRTTPPGERTRCHLRLSNWVGASACASGFCVIFSHHPHFSAPSLRPTRAPFPLSMVCDPHFVDFVWRCCTSGCTNNVHYIIFSVTKRRRRDHAYGACWPAGRGEAADWLPGQSGEKLMGTSTSI